jgi:hypothetical protein
MTGPPNTGVPPPKQGHLAADRDRQEDNAAVEREDTAGKGVKGGGRLGGEPRLLADLLPEVLRKLVEDDQ